MKRAAVIVAVFALIFLGAPSPANAAPAECDLLAPLGFVCARVEAGKVLDAAGNVIGTVEPIVSTVTKTVPVPTTVPGPTRTVTAAPRTVTQSAAPTTVTESATPTTVTVTATPTNTPGRQNRNGSGTLGPDSGTPTLAEPPPVVHDSVPVLPDTPVAAAATGSVIGLVAGILIGVAMLYVVYRRGQLDGEKRTLQEFLVEIRGGTIPSSPKHRA